MNAQTFSEWMLTNGVRAVNATHYDGHFLGFAVGLRCGGPFGHGATVEAALADARDLNADYLTPEWGIAA